MDLYDGKMRVLVDGRKELCFDTTVEVLATLKYDKLFGYCSLCSSLCHALEYCPLNPKSLLKRKEIRDGVANRTEDRARSYKGVVINEGGSNQEGEKDVKSIKERVKERCMRSKTRDGRG